MEQIYGAMLQTTKTRTSAVLDLVHGTDDIHTFAVGGLELGGRFRAFLPTVRVPRSHLLIYLIKQLAGVIVTYQLVTDRTTAHLISLPFLRRSLRNPRGRCNRDLGVFFLRALIRWSMEECQVSRGIFCQYNEDWQSIRMNSSKCWLRASCFVCRVGSHLTFFIRMCFWCTLFYFTYICGPCSSVKRHDLKQPAGSAFVTI
jgi:hypothetical protein